MDPKAVGALGEKLAAAFLKKKGYHHVETNYRCRYGEMDIVSRKGNTLVFVEVRTRSSQTCGPPEESVTASKREKLVAVAETYLAAHSDLPQSWRIDFVAVEIAPDGKVKRLELIENAVS